MLNKKVCPDCRQDLKEIIYGMPAQEVAESGEFIIGGCQVDGLEPHWGCDNCGYRGFLGGREYKTRHTKPGYKPGTENSLNPEIIERVFDVIEATEEELWGWADGLWEARLELLQRGIPKEQIEAYGENAENWDAMPFEPTELAMIKYHPGAKRIIGAEIFFAEGKIQSYAYLLPGMSNWSGCYTTGDFATVQESLAYEEGMQTWGLFISKDASGDAFFGEETNLGNPLVDLTRAELEVTEQQLSKHASQFEKFFHSPWWFFEPTLAFALGKPSGLNYH